MENPKPNNKVKIVENNKFFNTPLNEKGEPYWIPIVVKDKSYLLGFINSYRFITELYDIDIRDVQIAISSDRFNDVLTDGSRIHKLTREELKKKLKEMYFDKNKEIHPENDTNILEQYYLSVSCVSCGMFHGFKEEDEIPEDDFKCSLCGNTLISYVHEYDEYFDFDGDSGDVEKIVEEINKENNS